MQSHSRSSRSFSGPRQTEGRDEAASEPQSAAQSSFQATNGKLPGARRQLRRQHRETDRALLHFICMVAPGIVLVHARTVRTLSARMICSASGSSGKGGHTVEFCDSWWFRTTYRRSAGRWKLGLGEALHETRWKGRNRSVSSLAGRPEFWLASINYLILLTGVTNCHGLVISAPGCFLPLFRRPRIEACLKRWSCL
jgi:hypothetical protein